ncbi:MAG: class I SAM-dependent methyltransferase [Chlamydiia bacterium]
MLCTDEQSELGSNAGCMTARAWQVIAAGVGCQCLVALSTSGALQDLVLTGELDSDYIRAAPNPHALQAALVTLCGCEAVVQKSPGCFCITDIGRALVELIGVIRMNFDGYAGLLARQSALIQGEIADAGCWINGPAVAQASLLMSEHTIKPTAMQVCRHLVSAGRICDLGCGSGWMLSTLCQESGLSGLGVELDPEVVAEARRTLPSRVEMIQADIGSLVGCWPDVSLVLQFHVFHDFSIIEDCVRIMRALLERFPSMEYFVYVDSVAPAVGDGSILPGFDYDHGLQGKTMRTRDETLTMFERSLYEVQNEMTIPGLPQTYLWVLKPKRS